MDVPRSWRETQWTVGNYDWWSKDKIVAFFEDPSALRKVDEQHLYDLHGKAVKGAVPRWLRHEAVADFSPDRSKYTSEHWNGMQLTWMVHDVWSQRPVGSWAITSHTPQPQMDQDMGYWSPTVQWSADGKSLYQIETWPGPPRLLAQVTERPLSDLSKGHAYSAVPTFEWDAGVMVQDGMALVRQYNLDNAREFPMQEWVLNRPGTTMKKWKLHAPKGKVFIDYIPSPDMKRAVWLMGVPSTKVGGIGEHGYPYYAVSLWSSGLRGENMRELGAIQFASKRNDDLQDAYQYVGGIEWNPDGKHVSFVYMRKLYWIGV